MNRFLPLGGALLAAALLQVSIAPEFAIQGVVPDLLFLVAVTVALVSGANAGATGGFFAGLTLDMLGMAPIGPWALVLAVVGFIAGTLHASMFASGWIVPLTVVFVAGLAAETSYWMVLTVLGESSPFWATFLGVMLPGVFYNTVLALLAYPWLARLLRRDPAMATFKRLA